MTGAAAEEPQMFSEVCTVSRTASHRQNGMIRWVHSQWISAILQPRLFRASTFLVSLAGLQCESFLITAAAGMP
ncbi:hypothetical protein CGCF413_v012807 [Colletotrichum fructicola]|nr:hypothetical protein CGCF413_v012807 [Colletotrichum fructicola]